MLILGIDPGSSGAFAVYDTESRRLVGPVQDMPTWYQVVGKRKRPRLDAMAIADMFDEFQVMGVELIVMEAVNEGGFFSRMMDFVLMKLHGWFGSWFS